MPEDIAALNEADFGAYNEDPKPLYSQGPSDLLQTVAPDFDQLRANVEALTIVSELRRQIIGGISEDDVKQCINSIQHNYQESEKALLDKIETLESNKRKMVRDFELLKQKSESEKAVLQNKLDQTLTELSQFRKRCEEAETELLASNDKYLLQLNQLENDSNLLSVRCSELVRQTEEIEQHCKQLAEEKLDLENKHRTQKFRIAVLEQEISISKSELDERIEQCEKLKQHNSELVQALQDHEDRTDKEIRAKRIELANSLEMREMLEARIEELKEQLSQSKEKADELYQAYLEMEQKAQLLEKKNSEHSKPISYKEEIEAIYNQLNNLNEQLIVNENLQRELELERQRAEKAELGLAELVECVADLKNRMYADQIQLEGYFMHLEEKQRAVQNDVDEFRSNLKKFCGDTGDEINDLYETIKNRYDLLKKVSG
jgi:hypothetical protein